MSRDCVYTGGMCERRPCEALNVCQASELGKEINDPPPIDMILHCPACRFQHVDAPEPVTLENNHDPARWTNPPHCSHLCAACGFIWRPADVPTNGVETIKTRGKDDS